MIGELKKWMPLTMVCVLQTMFRLRCLLSWLMLIGKN